MMQLIKNFIIIFTYMTPCYGFVAMVKDDKTDGIYAAVAFRGTQGSLIEPDWMTDFNCKREDGIHRGFKKKVEGSIEIWTELLRNLKTKYAFLVFKEILFTGHSSGAAEASISAVLFHDNMGTDSDFNVENVNLH